MPRFRPAPRPARPSWLPDPDAGETTFVGRLLRSETVGGTVALVAAVLAVLWANSPVADGYAALRHATLGVPGLRLDLEHWAADGALALFFFVAGLELKRELLVGSLRRPADAVLPVVAALGGVAVPALLFTAVNLGNGTGRGWAIPSATDIAFALAVLAVAGSALPQAARAFLLTLAVVDDLVVIVIIAAFYSSSLHLTALLAALGLLGCYALLQHWRVRWSLVYLPLALAAWFAVHESGIHATVAGVALGLLTRVRPDPDENRSPAERLEHRLSPLSAGVAVPFFALMSAGVAVSGGPDLVGDPVFVGVVLGLVVGKPLGVLAGAWLGARITGRGPGQGLGWPDLLGVALLCGVGFTVSLLVSDLSFTGTRLADAKAGVLAGSALAAVAAVAVLRVRVRRHRARSSE